MITEKVPLKLAPLNLQQIQYSGFIAGLKKRQSFELTPFQMQALDQVSQKKSIAQVMTYFLNKRIMPSFLQFKALLTFLIEEELLTNTELKSYLSSTETPPTSFLDDFIGKISGSSEIMSPRQEVERTSFFRSLDPLLRDVFLNHMKVIDCPAEIAICTEGQKQRSLYALLKGQARVVKNSSAGLRKLAILEEGSVFGETGYFLGETRTASVITNTKSVVARFSYVPELFDKRIDTEKAKSLQQRFWLIHALLKSEIFKELPQDCFDALLFAGKPVTFAPHQFVCIEEKPGNSCYIVIQGKISISRKGKFVRTLDQGDCFGEMALIINNGFRTASAQTQTEVLAIEISYDNFYKLLAENLILGCEIERLALERWRSDSQR